MNPSLVLAASLRRSSLDDSPWFLAVLFLVIGVVLGIFGIRAIITRSTYDKWGNRMQGGLAVFNGIIMCIGALMCAGACLFQVALGLDKSGVFDDLIGNSANNAEERRFDQDTFAGKPNFGNPNERHFEPGTPFSRQSIPDSPFPGSRFNAGLGRNKPRQDATPEQLQAAFGSGSDSDTSNDIESNASDDPFGTAVGNREPAEPEVYDTFDSGLAVDLGAASAKLPMINYSLSNAQKSKSVGGQLGSSFNEHGPAGSLLVGLRVSVQGRAGAVAGFQPIYQSQDQYYYGEPVGAVKSTELLLAKPGYVVGGVTVSGQEQLSSIKLKFLKLNSSTGQLDEFDQYDSKVIGKISKPVELFAKGWHVVGLFGNQDSDKVVSVGLAAVQAKVAGDSVAAGGAAESDFRVWHNKSRKFSVEAKFSSLQNGKVTLLKKDGSEIKVAVDTLCDEDQKWLRNK